MSGKQNAIADALSRRPKVNAITTLYHHDLEHLPDMYPNDPDFASIWQALKEGRVHLPYSIKGGYSYHHQAISIAWPLQRKVMNEVHSLPYAGHRGIMSTTHQALERYFFWPTMRTDIEKYVRECDICQKVKYDRRKVSRHLQPLPIPSSPWESITMDFITDLPKKQNGNDAIKTMVDRFSKQAHYIPVKKTIKADHM